MRKAIFFDKDGTLIPNIPYNVNPDLMSLYLNTCSGYKLYIMLIIKFLLYQINRVLLKEFLKSRRLGS